MTTLVDIEYRSMDGETEKLADHEGEVVLVVNVVSQCGLTRRTTGSSSSTPTGVMTGSRSWRSPERFGAQEPGTDAEIAGSARASTRSRSR